MKKMKNLTKSLRDNDVGDIGIGAMIVFIAMVLIAGIAASVLIQTANRLEIQAMTTGQETTDEVSTGIGVEDISAQKGGAHVLVVPGGGKNTWTNFSARLTNMTITVSPRAGSSDIDLSKTVIEISNSTVKCILKYDSGEYRHAPVTGGIFATPCWDGLGANEFGIIELADADNSTIAATPIVNRGDHVALTVNLTACFVGLQERTDVWGMVMPEQGAYGIFAFRTPASFTDTIFDLY